MKNLTDKERLTKIETQLEGMSQEMREIKQIVAEAVDERKELYITIKDTLSAFAGKYAQREWVEGLDRRVKNMEDWKTHVDYDDNLCSRIEILEDWRKSFKVYATLITGIVGTLSPIVYTIIQYLISKIF